MNRNSDALLAVVTGASRGIGAGIARRFRSDGSVVVGISLQREAVEANQWVQCDVGNAEAMESTFRGIYRDFGKIDVLVNCAGVATSGGVTDTTVEQWQSAFAVNTTGAWLAMRAVLPAMRKQGFGRVVNIASIAGKRGEPQMTAYCVSKHALIGLTRAAATEYARTGVTINAVCPGCVETDLLNDGIRHWSKQAGRPFEVGRRVFQSFNPQNRFFDTEEVIEMVCYLASPAARGVNGQALNLCGGALQT